ncbi:MAG: flagellin [Dehalococcoidia bacterium]|nr:flagellin [Dehalococcoidia bacterium]
MDAAIEQVNAQRGQFGAVQNRLESTVRSLSVAVENLSASESRIRDADIAKLSSELVSNQILQQAGVSVLSQANSTPQAAVQLLQG